MIVPPLPERACAPLKRGHEKSQSRARLAFFLRRKESFSVAQVESKMLARAVCFQSLSVAICYSCIFLKSATRGVNRYGKIGYNILYSDGPGNPPFLPNGLIFFGKFGYKNLDGYTWILYFFILCWMRLLVIPNRSAAWA